MSGWNFADAWEAVAESVPESPALLHGDRSITWGAFDAMADGIARAVLDAGVGEGASFTQYLGNRPEYLVSVFAAFKLGLPPVNTNYRYIDDELVYLWDNSDAAVVAFEGQYTERVEAVRDRVPGVKLWLWVDDGTGPCPAWSSSAGMSGRQNG
jgi:fatty-acyl-CoA synthase